MPDIAEIDARHRLLSPSEREKRLRIGRQVGSKASVAQLSRVANGMELYRGPMADHGFGDDDEAEVVWTRDSLIVSGAERVDAQVERKVTNVELQDAEKEAQKKRKGVRALARRVPEKLRALDTEASRAAANDVDAVLQKTSATGDEPEDQAVQLDLLAGVLGNAEVARVVGAERAARRAAECRTASAALRSADAKHSRPQGTPEQTQRLDLLDGSAVILARHARAASVAASEELGDPAIAKAFELVDLGGR
jgi:hypothetical protein